MMADTKHTTALISYSHDSPERANSRGDQYGEFLLTSLNYAALNLIQCLRDP